MKAYIEGMTIAVTKMKEMLNFYSTVFEIQFEQKEMFGVELFSGGLGDIKVLFCPANIARNTAKQNRHQLDIIVVDLKKVLNLCLQNGGSQLGQIKESELDFSIGLNDPNNNTLVCKQLK